MRIIDTSDLWWKTAVVYCLDVETFLDWDGDGSGDLAGLAQRIDYLAELGITCLWLMPFYPTPDRDDGYDITDFYAVDRRLGTLGTLVEVLRTAHDRGMRVIADLVVNHTSDQHPWFQSARSDRDSPYRGWYVWRDEPPADIQAEPVFPDQEKGVWSYDEKAGRHYLHRFYKHQPDLDVTNPQVRDEIARVIDFWLQLGLSGFRVDAVPFFLETLGTEPPPEGVGDPHDYLRDLRAFLNRRSGEAILLGEVNLPHEEQLRFFGGDRADELHMQFDFIGMQHLYLALARQDAEPLVRALRNRPVPPPECQWATFVRNHDELTLDKLSEDERQEVFAAFGHSRTCSFTAGGCVGGSRRCSLATNGVCAWSTACCSRCPARRCCSTARRSAWEKTSTHPAPRRAYADAVERRTRRRLYNPGIRPAARPARDRRVRPCTRQCQRAAPRPRLAAELHHASGSPLP